MAREFLLARLVSVAERPVQHGVAFREKRRFSRRLVVDNCGLVTAAELHSGLLRAYVNIFIKERVEFQSLVSEHYRLESTIGTAGASSRTIGTLTDQVLMHGKPS